MTIEQWKTKPLGEAMTFQRGFDITKDDQCEGPYPVFSSSGPKSTHAEFKVRGPGLVIGRKGTLGSVFYSESDFWPHDTTLWVKDFHGNDPKFCYYFLHTMAFERLDAGASNPSLNRNHIHTIPIRWPDYVTQEKIAAILSAYDNLIGDNQSRIRILEEMARALYREWFVNFRFPGYENVPLVASALGKIPEGWEGSVSALVTIERESINPFESGSETFEHFSLPSFDDARQAGIELGVSILSGKYVIDSSCVLLSKLNPRKPRVWLPQPKGVLRAVASTEFMVLKPKVGVTRAFLYAKCISDEFAKRFAVLAIGTSTSHQRVKPENFLAMMTVVPPQEMIERFSHQVSALFTQSQQLRDTVRNLRDTRDLLLPRLLSGTLSISASGRE